MPGIMNLVAYHAENSTSVLEGSDESDDEVSACLSNVIGALIESADSVVSPPLTEFSYGDPVEPCTICGSPPDFEGLNLAP